MSPSELRSAIASLAIAQSDLARLVDVTPRAISLWLSGERAVPGPMAAYLRLLLSLPQGQREAELARLGIGTPMLAEGFYKFCYWVDTGSRGEAMLVFEGGRIYGTDAGKSQYDGTYQANHETGKIDVRVRVELKAGEKSVAGPAQPFDWILEARGSLPPKAALGEVLFETNLGVPIMTSYELMRALPDR
jgi:hypothetical protein